jgi:RNA polymerase sigma-70 factor (ECF subfamily)
VRIARNRITDVERRPRERAIESLTIEMRWRSSRTASPHEALAHQDEIEHLVELLESMPEDYRRVIELRHFEALPFRQIGEQLGRSENAAQLLHAQAQTRMDELVSPQ